MKKHIPYFTLWLSLTSSILGLFAPVALAATATPKNSGQALEIAPPVITLSANPGQTLKLQIQLRDISIGNLIVTNQVNDFVAEGEDGTSKILFEDPGNDPYSMKAWVSPIPQLTMISRQIKQLPVTIVVPANASPGG